MGTGIASEKGVRPEKAFGMSEKAERHLGDFELTAGSTSRSVVFRVNQRVTSAYNTRVHHATNTARERT